MAWGAWRMGQADVVTQEGPAFSGEAAILELCYLPKEARPEQIGKESKRER